MAHSYQIELEHIRRALWTGSASVMVGSGFSRNALPLSSSVRQFALWGDLLADMEQRLGYRGPSGRGTSDALRLAAEFEEAFGRLELDALLQHLIPDEEYEPGPLHVQLLSLPWSDVFTTNYDTLLERSCRLVHEIKYDVIRRVEDIPRVHSPRIVKLNGTFPSNGPFIITENDFRTYPRQFAPFVNMVQQAAMETVLILIGFSGDDPNFLEWSGWVRDNLGEASPRIYLCGILDLTPARLHMLRSRHIVPVNLGDFVETYPDPGVRQRNATAWLLNFLAQGKPASVHRWPDSSSETDGNPSRTDVLRRLRKVRHTYPGWVVCPESNRYRLSHSLRQLNTEELLRQISSQAPHEQILSLRDFVWQSDICLLPLSPDVVHATRQALEAVNPYPAQLDQPNSTVRPTSEQDPRISWREVSESWVELAFVMLSTARQEFEEEVFRLWSERLKAVISQHPQWQARWHHQQCLYFLARFQLAKLKDALQEWSREVPNPEWDARRAAILAEIGEFNSSLELARRSLEHVRRSQVSRARDHRLLSAEGWLIRLCSWLTLNAPLQTRRTDSVARDSTWAQVIEMSERLSALEAEGCNPDSDVLDRTQRLKEQIWSRQGTRIKPSFDPGVWHMSSWSSYDIGMAWVWVLYMDQAALPPASVDREIVALAAHEIIPTHLRQAVSLFVRLGTKDQAALWLSRTRVAVLKDETVQQLFDWLVGAVAEALETAGLNDANSQPTGLPLNIIDVGIELLSRLSFRLSQERRNRLFNISIQLYQSNFLPFSTLLDLDQLFRRLFFGTSQRELERWLPTLLSLPILPNEDSRPEPFVSLNRTDYVRSISGIGYPGDLPRIVEGLILLVRNGTAEQRWRALRRLHTLYRANALDSIQEKLFAEAIWSRETIERLPAEIRYEKWVVLQLPEPTSGFAASVLRKAILESAIPDVNQTNVVDSIVYDAQHAIAWFNNLYRCTYQWWITPAVRDRRINWTSNEAATLLFKLSNWCSTNPWQKIENYDLGRLRRGSLRELVKVLEAVLAGVLFPRLTRAPLATKEGAMKLVDMLAESDCPSLLAQVAAIQFHPATADKVETLIKYALSSSSLDQVNEAASAVITWARWSQPHGPLPSPLHLIDSLISSIPYRWDRDSRLIETLVQIPLEYLNKNHLEPLCIALEQLLTETRLPAEVELEISGDEESRFQADRRAELRAAGAKLAASLFANCKARAWPIPSAVEQWSQHAQSDVLPEVRMAWEEELTLVSQAADQLSSKQKPPRGEVGKRGQAKRARSPRPSYGGRHKTGR